VSFQSLSGWIETVKHFSNEQAEEAGWRSPCGNIRCADRRPGLLTVTTAGALATPTISTPPGTVRLVYWFKSFTE